MVDIAPPVFVEALVAEPADEALDEPVLLRLAWGDVVPFDASLLLPFQDGVGGQLLRAMPSSLSLTTMQG